MYTADTKSRFHNADAEKHILGTLIMLSSEREKILLSVEEKYFAYGAHREIFSVIKNIIAANMEPELGLISQELHSLGSEITPYFVAELTGFVTANSGYFINKVTNDYRLRYYSESLNGALTKKFESGEVTPAEIETYLEEVLSNCAGVGRSNETVQLDFKSALEQLQSKEKLPVSTGFSKIDKCITGFSNGDLIILGGWTGQGKTAFALNTALKLVNEGHKVGMISLEMDRRKISDRFLAMSACVDLTRITGKQLDESEWEKLKRANKQMGNVEEHFYLTTSGAKLRDVIMQMRRFKNEKKCSLIIVDYLGLIENEELKSNRYLEICSITRALKLAAMQLDVPVLLLSQLSRPMKFIKNPEPQLGDLRDSGSIEQDADIVMFVYRKDEEKDNKRIIKIAKGRNVRTGNIELDFWGKFTRFEESVVSR